MTARNFLSQGFIKWSMIVLIAVSSIFIFLPFLVALLLGGVFAAVLHPYNQKLIKRFKIKRGPAALSLLTVVFIFVIVPFWIFILRGVKLTLKFINEHFPQFKITEVSNIDTKFPWESIQNSLTSVTNMFGIDPQSLQEILKSAALKTGQFLFNILQEFLTQLPAMTLFMIVIFMATYFALVDTPQIKGFFYKYSGLTDSQCDRFIQKLQASSQSIILANVLTGVIQALIVTTGSLSTQVGDPIFVFFITFTASFIPIGAAPVAAVLAIIAFSTDQVTAGIILLVVSAITGVVDNLVRPLLMKGDCEIHPFIAFMAVIGGVIALGLPGLFIGPLVAALLIHCLPILIESPKQ